MSQKKAYWNTFWDVFQGFRLLSSLKREILSSRWTTGGNVLNKMLDAMWGNDPCGTLFRLTIQVSSVLAHACLAVFTSNTLSFAGYVSLLCHDIFFTMHRERDPECRPRHNFFRNLWARNRASASLENLKVQRLPILHTGLAEITES